MTDNSVTPGEGSVNNLDCRRDALRSLECEEEMDDDRDDADDNFHGRQMDNAIEAERRQDAQVSRAAADYLRGGD